MRRIEYILEMVLVQQYAVRERCIEKVSDGMRVILVGKKGIGLRRSEKKCNIAWNCLYFTYELVIYSYYIIIITYIYIMHNIRSFIILLCILTTSS